MTDDEFFEFGVDHSGAERYARLVAKHPPWVIAKRHPLPEVAAEARGLEAQGMSALDRWPEGYTAQALQGWANACWAWLVVRWLGGEP